MATQRWGFPEFLKRHSIADFGSVRAECQKEINSPRPRSGRGVGGEGILRYVRRPKATGRRTVRVGHLSNIARQLGRKIRWDPVKEQILDDAEANALLDRPRRKGWELPKVS